MVALLFNVLPNFVDKSCLDMTPGNRQCKKSVYSVTYSGIRSKN